MTDYVVEIAPQAEREIVEAIGWYKTKSVSAADTFKSIVFDAVELISHSPLSWAKVSDLGVRKFVLPRYPYSLFFNVHGDIVIVLALAHHRRAPQRWE